MIPRPTFERVTLAGRHVTLVPLGPEHAADLLQIVSGDRSTFGYTWIPEADPIEVDRYIETAAREHEQGLGLAFASVETESGIVRGSTRFMNAEYWTTSDRRPREAEVPDALEIGSTWLAPEAQRTGMNTEAKIMMIDHAIDRIGVKRVTIKTDVRNARSRANIERVGARLDGVLRAHMPASDGGIRDTAVYSLLAGEWPAAREALVARLRPN